MNKITLIALLMSPILAGCTPQGAKAVADIFSQSGQSRGVVATTPTPSFPRETYRVYTGSATPGQYTIERTY